jgi:hypothetical protein
LIKNNFNKINYFRWLLFGFFLLMGLYAFRQMSLVPPVQIRISDKQSYSYLIAYSSYPGASQLISANTTISISPRKAYLIVLGFLDNANQSSKIYINNQLLERNALKNIFLGVSNGLNSRRHVLGRFIYSEYVFYIRYNWDHYIIPAKYVLPQVSRYYAWLVLGFLSLIAAYLVLSWQLKICLDTLAVVLPSLFLSFMTFPGLLSRDTVCQWAEALRNHYFSWHPPIMSYIASHLVGIVPPALGMTFLQLVMLCTGLLLIARFFYTGVKQYLLYFFLLICPLSFVMGLGPDKDYFFVCAYILSLGFILQLDSTKTWVLYGIALASIFFASLIRYDGILFIIPLIVFWAISFYKIKQFKLRNILFLFGMIILIDLSCFLSSQGFTYIKTQEWTPQGHLGEVFMPQIVAATMDKNVLSGLHLPMWPDTKDYPSPVDYCSSYQDVNWDLFFRRSTPTIRCQKFLSAYTPELLHQWLYCWIQNPWEILRYDFDNIVKAQVLPLLSTEAIFEYTALYTFLPKAFCPRWFMKWMHLPLLTGIPLYYGACFLTLLFLSMSIIELTTSLERKLYDLVSKIFLVGLFFIVIRFFLFTFIDYRFVALLPLLYWLAIGSTIFIFIERKIGRYFD